MFPATPSVANVSLLSRAQTATGPDCLLGVTAKYLSDLSYGPQNRHRRTKPHQTDGQDSPNGHGPSEAPTQPSSPDGDKGGEVQQLQLQGHLGRDPWFNLDGDQQVAGFPLAVHNENEIVWHKVVVFDATAEQLQKDHSKGVIRKGRLVDVTGQTVVREEPKP
jgi:hypothetical protein